MNFAVVGDPIAHSKSPRMHAAAFASLGMPHTFEAIRATEAELAAVLQRVREGDLAGLCVTVPHKIRVMDLVDVIDPSASTAGAANVIARDANGTLTAHNTDVPALAAEITALSPARGAALVLGTGGASRAAVAALRDYLHIPRIVVRGRPLAADPAIDADVSVIVQATSCGMLGADPGDIVARAVAWETLPRGAVMVEAIYAPPETPILSEARRRGHRAVNGLGMLARQGALAFELWLGVPAPLEAMRAAL